MIIPFSFIITCIIAMFSSVDVSASNCKYEAYYKYPQKEKFNFGERVYVQVEPRYGHKDVKYVKLYLDGHFVRTEKRYKYEWGQSSSSDNALRNPSPGWHNLKAVIYTYCGKSYTIYKKFYVKNGGGHDGGNHGGTPCFDRDPMNELGWLRSKLNSLNGYKVCMYYKHGKYYFKFYPCNGHGKTYWYTCYGKICNYPSGAQKKKCWDFCDNHDNGGGHDNAKCFDHDPRQEILWLKRFLNDHHNYKLCLYKKNGKYIFKLFPCSGHGKVYWYFLQRC